jgi:hypothetical protein
MDIKGRVKVKLSLFTTGKHAGQNMCGYSTLIVCTTWRSVVSLTPWLLCSREKAKLIENQAGLRRRMGPFQDEKCQVSLPAIKFSIVHVVPDLL